MVTRREIHAQVDAQQKVQRDLGVAGQRMARVERRVTNRGRTIRSEVRRGVRYVGKHRARAKRKPKRVAAGMAARGVVAATVGTARTTGYAVKKAGQGYRAARPHVAAASLRLRQRAYTYATVYGGPAGQRATAAGLRAEQAAHRAGVRARSRAGRVNARMRTRRRRVAGRMQQHAVRYRHSNPRLAQVLSTAASSVGPRRTVMVRCTCGAQFHTRARAANHVCQDAIRAENAAIDRAKQWQPAAGPTAGHHQPRSNRAAAPSTTTPGGTAMASNKVGQAPIAGFTPSDYEEWMQFLHAKAAYHKHEADDLQDLAERMDHQEGMDPRSLTSLYMGAEAEQVVAKGFVDAYAKFWTLYQDRLEQAGDTGRRMTSEDKFFGQAK